MSDDFDKSFWEAHYRSHTTTRHHHHRPNPHLVSVATNLAHGTALDAGCGEGADAIWLASHGWQVTAVDIASSALERARRHAETLGDDITGRIEWLAADLARWQPTDGHFDLVTSQYVHVPAGSRDALFRALAAAVAPGGTLLIVGHHPSDLDTTISRGSAAERYFTAGDVAAKLDPNLWDIAVADAVPRPESNLHGDEGTVHDAVLRAQRRP